MPYYRTQSQAEHSLDPGSAAEVAAVIRAWGPVEVPVLQQVPIETLQDMVVRAFGRLTETGAITAPQGAELLDRVRALGGLPRVVAAEVETVHAPAAGSAFDILAATLPNPGLFSFWDVLHTAAVALAVAIGDAIAGPLGGALAGGLAEAAWHEWVDPALSTA